MKALLRRTAASGLCCLLAATPAWPAAQAPGGLRAELLESAQRWSARNRTDVARQMIAKLLAVEPDDPEGLAFLGDIALRENKPDEARAILRTLQNTQPLHPATRELQQLVRVYGSQRETLARMRLTDRAGRSAEAAALARELFPDGPPRYSALGPEIARITGQRLAGPRSSKPAAVAQARPAPVNPKPLAPRATDSAALASRGGAAPRPAQTGNAAPAGPANATSSASRAAAAPRTAAATGATPTATATAPAKGVAPKAATAAATATASNGTTAAAATATATEAPAAPSAQKLAEQRSNALQAQADAQVEAGRLSPALRLLEEALTLTPEDPWLRFSLARLYLRLQLPAEARSVMDQGVERAPDDTDMRYARALTLAAMDEDAQALDELQRVTPEARSPGMRALEQRLTVNLLVARASAEPQERDASLRRAEARAGNDNELLRTVANAWLRGGQAGEGAAVLERRLQRAPAAPASVELALAQLLDAAGDDAALEQRLPGLLRRSGWTAPQARALLDVHVDHVERLIGQHMQAGRRTAARALAHMPLPLLATVAPANPGAAAATGTAGVDEANWRAQAQARLLLAAGDYHAVAALPGPVDTDLLLSAARQARRSNAYTDALGLFRQARSAELAPAAGQAVDTAALAKVDADIAGIEARRRSWVEVGQRTMAKNSTEGLSSLRGWERPMVAWLPWGYDGTWFAHVDPVQLDAGRYAGGDPFAQPGAEQVTGGVPQRAEGVNVGLGYQGEDLRWDIGQIGLGFAVHNWVGGLRTSGSLGTSDYSLEVSRRPLTGTLLSYAGTEDPITHAVWGGVVATGVGARIGHDFGPISTSASIGAATLSGQNVADNNRLQWRLSADRDVYRSPTQVVNVGLTLSGLHYDRDLSGFTWGHGGYYSPQRNLTLSLPVEWSGREGNFTWRLKASVSVSDSSSSASDYYPTSPVFQQQTGNPAYAAGGSTGTGWAASGTAEYQVTPRLAVGAQLEREVSDYYTPLNLLLYARWLLEPAHEPLAPRPRPVQAYSQF